MAESGVKEAALRLRALVDRCRVGEDGERGAPTEAQVDVAIERRLAEQAAAIADLGRQIFELSELIRSSTLAAHQRMVVASPNRAGRRALQFLTVGAVALGLVVWAWARDDFGVIVNQVLRIAGGAVGS